MKSLSKVSGFTLIETIMVVLLLGLIMAIGSNLLFSIFKGASKVEITKEVKQNGDYAMNVMVRAIRGAAKVDSCAAGSLKITNKDGLTTEFKCLAENDVTKIASASAGTEPGRLTGNNVTLSSSGSSCPASLNFTCTAPVASPPTVTISFTLYQKGVLGQRIEEQAQVPFQGTVSLRTY